MNLKYHTHQNWDGTCYIEQDCDKCREKFEKAKSLCAFCLSEVSNKDFLKNDHHQTGKCKARYVYKIPEPNWAKPLPYPMPDNYNSAVWLFQRSGKTLTEWWGLDIDWTAKRIEALETEQRELKKRLARRARYHENTNRKTA